MKRKYTFDNLVDILEMRADFFRDYQRLIDDLKSQGHRAAALKHARNKKRIAEELELL